MWETIATSEALLGVIIGGTIGLVASVMLLVVDQRKWRADRKLEHLRIKRGEMEARFKRLREAIPAAMEDKAFTTEILDLTMRCPKNVELAIATCVQEGFDLAIDRQKHHYRRITTAMTVALRKFDQQIDDAV